MTATKRQRTKPAIWYLYMLRCSDGTFYTGITNDLARRLARHGRGTASRYTRSRLPVVLIHGERCRGKSDALKKEYRVKNLTRKEKEEYVVNRASKKKHRVEK